MRVLELAEPRDTLAVRAETGGRLATLIRGQMIEPVAGGRALGVFRVSGLRIEGDHPADPSGRHVVVELAEGDERAAVEVAALRATADEIFAFEVDGARLQLYVVPTRTGVAGVFWPLDEYGLS